MTVPLTKGPFKVESVNASVCVFMQDRVYSVPRGRHAHRQLNRQIFVHHI